MESKMHVVSEQFLGTIRISYHVSPFLSKKGDEFPHLHLVPRPGKSN